MTISVLKEELKEAKDRCMAKIVQSESKPGYCDLVWDEVMCWDAVKVGKIAKQPCPSYILDFGKKGFAVRTCGANGVWLDPYVKYDSTRGWTNFSDCFKQMDPEFVSIKHDLNRLELISNIGYTLSLVSLVVAVLVICLSRSLHCKSNRLHVNLFVAFIFRALVSLLKDILFVEGLGLESDTIQEAGGKRVFKKDGLHWECKLIIVVFMYAVAASMLWIFMEGVYLHTVVSNVFFAKRTGIRVYVIIGWLSPLTFVIPWVIVRILCDNTLCWNNDEFGFFWIIKGPISLTILINFAFFINIIRLLCIRIRNQQQGTRRNQDVRKLVKFSFVLIPLFGLLYIGTVAYPTGVDLDADIVYLYFEMFYNSFQGFFLAVLFCFLNQEVHIKIRQCWHRQQNVVSRIRTLTSKTKVSWFSQTLNVHVITNRKITDKLQRDLEKACKSKDENKSMVDLGLEKMKPNINVSKKFPA